MTLEFFQECSVNLDTLETELSAKFHRDKMEDSTTLLAFGATIVVLAGTMYLVKKLVQSQSDPQVRPEGNASGKYPQFSYVEYDECQSIPNVIVDGNRNDSTILELSHWRGNAIQNRLTVRKYHSRRITRRCFCSSGISLFGTD